MAYNKVILKKLFLNLQKHSQVKIYDEIQESCKRYISSERIQTEMFRLVFKTQSNT